MISGFLLATQHFRQNSLYNTLEKFLIEKLVNKRIGSFISEALRKVYSLASSSSSSWFDPELSSCCTMTLDFSIFLGAGLDIPWTLNIVISCCLCQMDPVIEGCLGDSETFADLLGLLDASAAMQPLTFGFAISNWYDYILWHPLHFYFFCSPRWHKCHVR